MELWLSVVSGLLRQLGVESEESDSSGIVTLYVDGDLPIFLLPGDAGATLVLHAGIGAIPDEGAEDVLASLLEGNTLEIERNGFAFGLVPGNDQVILIGRVSLDGLSDEIALAQLERFVERASAWREIFDSLVEKAEDEAVEEDDELSADAAAGERPPFQDFA